MQSIPRVLLSLGVVLALLYLLVSDQCYSLEVVPHAEPDDEIRVMYLEAPLFKVHLGDVLEKVNLFHVGLGFENLRSGENWTVDYIATVSVLESVFPLEMGDSGTDMTWLDGGHVVIAEGIDEEYWTRYTDVYSISGDAFNRFICWTPTYNATLPHYLLFSIYNDKVPVDDQVKDPIKSGNTCIEFCWVAMQVMHNLGGVKTREADTLKRDLMYLVIGEKPELVNPRKQKDVEELRKFYDNWLWIRNIKDISWEEALNKTISMFKGQWHYHFRDEHQNHAYYRMQLVKPYFGISYRDVAIPTEKDPRAPQNVSYSNQFQMCHKYVDNGISPLGIALIVMAVGTGVLIPIIVAMAITVIIFFIHKRQELAKSSEPGLYASTSIQGYQTVE